MNARTLKVLESFGDMFRRSIITQSIITVILIGTVCYMYISKIPVPNDLISIVMLVIGFYFGGKAVVNAPIPRK